MEENKKMTVFYRKRTNNISNITSQEIGYEFFGELAEDYELTHGRIISELDDVVMSNPNLFIVQNDKLVLKNSDTFKKYIE